VKLIKGFFKMAGIGIILMVVLAVVFGGENEGTTTKAGSLEVSETKEVFTIGDTVEVDGIRVTVNAMRNVAENFGSHNAVVFNVTVENTREKAFNLSSLMMFTAYDDDGYKMKWTLGADTRGNLDGEIGPGRSLRGEIAYRIGESQPAEFIINNPNMLRSGQTIFEL